MDSVNTKGAALVHADRRRKIPFYPSDCRLRFTSLHKITCLVLIIIALLESPISRFSVYSELLITVRMQIRFPVSRAVGGTNCAENYAFSFKLVYCLMVSNFWLFTMIILLSGDVHPNPGPGSASSFGSSPTASIQTSFYEHLSIVHVNIQSLFPKMDILEVELQYYDLVILTETWLSPSIKNEDLLISNFGPPYRKDRIGRTGGGVAIYVKSEIPSRQLDVIDNIVEGLCIEISIRNHKFLLCGFYRPPNSGNDYWEAMEQSFDNLNNLRLKDIFILGDFNCDMLDPHNDNKIRNLSLAYNLTQLIDEPTHFTEQSSSLLDLILAKKPENVLYSGVISPFVPNLVRFHCPTVLYLKFRKHTDKTFKRHIWIYEQGDFNLFRDKLSNINWDDAFLGNNLNEITEILTKTIIEAAKESIPNKIITVRPNEPEWITSNIKQQIRKRKRLFRYAKRNNNENAWRHFKQKRNQVTDLIRRAKKQYFDKLSMDLKTSSTNSKTWHKISSKFLKFDSNQAPIPCLETDDDIIENDLEKANLLNKHFIEQSTVNDNNAKLPTFLPVSAERLNLITITREDVIYAIKCLDVNKASGPDLVSSKLIKEGMYQLVSPLVMLFNLSLSLKKFPNLWKKSNVIAIHKKESRTNPNNYRPISLLSIIGKLMERCIHKYLYNYLTTNDLISPYQSGFRSGDSTTNQLLYLYDEFSKALDEGKEIRAVFCDISKAFDRVWHKGLLFKLKSIGLSQNLLDWFSDYLSNRQQRVCIKGYSSSWLPVSAGVPQGSILGPVLFLIYINDIVHDIGGNIRLFADDTSLFIIVHDPVAAANQMNKDLATIYLWADSWLVNFNPNKTESLIISKKRNKPIHPPLYMGNTMINEVKTHKHLGITLSDDCSWNEHLKIISTIAWKRIGSLRHNKFRLDKRSLNKLYITYIRSLLEYGNIIWDNCSLENKRSLENIQLEAARIVTGATKLCSVHKTYTEAGWETLQNRRTSQKLCQLYKIVNGLTPQYLRNLLPPRVQDTSRYTLRNRDNYIIPASRTASYYNSYFPTTLRDWNLLDQNLRSASSLNIFRKTINNNLREISVPPKYFSNIQTSRLGQIYHARLRLECSSLNYHLYSKNIIDSPLCTCGNVENTFHYLMICPKYRYIRERYLLPLPYPLTLSVLLNGIPDGPIEDSECIFRSVQLFILASKRFQSG